MPNVGELAQYAALPYVKIAGSLQVCLITSRGTKRWIIPKGWPHAARTPFEQAAREAKEEAGVLGPISQVPIGTYMYRKRLHFLAWAKCRVSVFPLRVTAQRLRWREQAERELQWMNPEQAAELVRERDLASLLRSLPAWIESQSGSCAAGPGGAHTI